MLPIERASMSSPMLSPAQLAEVKGQYEASFSLLHTPDDLANQAYFYKALGDSTRLKIIGLLLISELCLCQLVELTAVPTSTMTHHLQVLDRGGVIVTNRIGKFTIYTIRESKRAALIHSLAEQE